MILAFILAIIAVFAFVYEAWRTQSLSPIGLAFFAGAFAAFVLFGSHQFDIKTF